jgi:hypothetical protein
MLTISPIFPRKGFKLAREVLNLFEEGKELFLLVVVRR